MIKGEVRLKLVVGKAGQKRMYHLAGLANQAVQEGKRVLALVQDVTPAEFMTEYMGLTFHAGQRMRMEDSLEVCHVADLSQVVSRLVGSEYDVAVIDLRPELNPRVNIKMAHMLSMDVLESISRILSREMYLSVQLKRDAFVDDGTMVWSMAQFNNYLFEQAYTPELDPTHEVPEGGGRLPASGSNQLLCAEHAELLEATATGTRVRGMYPCTVCSSLCNVYYNWG